MVDRFALARKDPRYAVALTTPVRRPSVIGPLFGVAAMAELGVVLYAATWMFGAVFWAGAAVLLVMLLRSVRFQGKRGLLIVGGVQSDAPGAGRSERAAHTARFRTEHGEFVRSMADGGLSMQEPGVICVAATRGGRLLAFEPLETPAAHD